MWVIGDIFLKISVLSEYTDSNLLVQILIGRIYGNGNGIYSSFKKTFYWKKQKSYYIDAPTPQERIEV